MLLSLLPFISVSNGFTLSRVSYSNLINANKQSNHHTILMTTKESNANKNDTPRLDRRLKLPNIRKSLKTLVSKIYKPPQPGKLILIRCGESNWSEEGRYCGWTNTPPNDLGMSELEISGNLLREYGYTVDVAYTSAMTRAIDSVHILLRELKQVYRPVIISHKLNARSFGGMEGLSMQKLSELLGELIYVV